VLIIGNKGSGKSTFIDRFFNLVLEASLRKKWVEEFIEGKRDR
jgi:predicted kinase